MVWELIPPLITLARACKCSRDLLIAGMTVSSACYQHAEVISQTPNHGPLDRTQKQGTILPSHPADLPVVSRAGSKPK